MTEVLKRIKYLRTSKILNKNVDSFNASFVYIRHGWFSSDLVTLRHEAILRNLAGKSKLIQVVFRGKIYAIELTFLLGYIAKYVFYFWL